MPVRGRSESVSNAQLAEKVTTAPISRTQSLPTARLRTAAGSVPTTQDDASTYRRKSWFRHLGQKLGFERDRHSQLGSPPRPSSPHISATPGSPPHSDVLHFKNPFDTNSQDFVVATSPESSTASLKERFKRLSKTSIEGRDRQASSDASAMMPDRLGGKRGSVTGGGVGNSAAQTCPVPELAPYLSKRVAFAPEVFAHDPPQIIPPLHPQPGNVEFTNDGKLVVTPSDKLRELGLMRYLDSNHTEVAQRATIQAAENASRLHQQLSGKTKGGFFSKVTGEHNQALHDAEDSEWDRELLDSTAKCQIPVDGIRSGYAAVDESGSDAPESDREAGERAKLDADMSPEKVYTRCCHLREIMPIKSMLRQLKGTKAPVTNLRIGNTKPTMIEILAFSDFLTVMPVMCVNLHNLVITAEMLRLILHGLERSTKLGQLSLKNTKLDELGWKYLCAFLLKRTSLSALGLECDFSRKVSVPEFDRQDMDWMLLNEALKAGCNSIDLLELAGTKIPTLQLELLLRDGFKHGRSLGMAQNSVNHEELIAIQDWVSAAGSRAAGVDLSHNDLSKEWPIVQDLLYNPKMSRLDLNATNLHRTSQVNPFAPDLISPCLKSLDLSNNPQMFPSDLPQLVDALPVFSQLARLSLNGCGITPEMMVMLCEALSHCHQLAYLSLKDNGSWTENSAAALCVAVRMSRSICTVEVDFTDWSEPHKARITKYCIENLEHSTSGAKITDLDERDMEEFKRDLHLLSSQLNGRNPDTTIDKSMVERVISLRGKVRERLGQLLEKKSSGTLSVRDRENLISLYYYDGSLDRLIKQCAVYSGLLKEEVLKDGNPADEQVSHVDAFKPSLSRRSSHSSLISLKKQEHEEGELHKINTFLAQNPDILDDKVPDLTGDMLRKALLEQSNSGSAETVISQLRQLHALDLEKILD